MNVFKRTISAVLAAVVAVGYGGVAVVCDGGDREVDGTGAIVQCALDLSESWTVTEVGPLVVPYSAVGWDIEDNGTSGWAVTLELTPIAGGNTSVVACDLAGRGTSSWDTSSVRNDAYVLRHYVRKNSTVEPIETLEAHLVFDREAAVRPLETLAAVAEASFSDAGRSCAVLAMGGSSWTAVGFAGDGVAGPAIGAATLTFALDGIGSFAFEYRCAAGETLTVAVDGGEPRKLAVATDWKAARIAFGDVYAHTVVVSAAGVGTAVRGVRWDTGRSSAGKIVQKALDLSDVWDKRDLDCEPILWSSLGWADVAEEDGGKTVTLRLVQLSDGAEQILGSGLKGHRQVTNWTPREVKKQIYNIRHIVVGGSSLETDLNAYFTFDNYEHLAPKEADVRAAIRSVDGTGWNFGIANDAENWWTLAGSQGEGIKAPSGTSKFTFTVNGRGAFKFDYVLDGVTWTVKVDGRQVGQLDAASVPTSVELSLNGSGGVHTIEFITVLSDGASFASVRNVRWDDADYRVGLGKSGACPVDLREGMLVVQRAAELMPFTWSSTNFTGSALVKGVGYVQIDPASVASVRVVRVTGEGEDVACWTTEVADTEKLLVAEKPGESTVKWRGVRRGVWKAELAISTGGAVVHAETRVLDLRCYDGPGLMLILK